MGKLNIGSYTMVAIRVTRLGDLSDFGPLFKAFFQQLIIPNLLHSKSIFVKVSKSIIFLVKPFLGNFYRHLANFFWSYWWQCTYLISNVEIVGMNLVWKWVLQKIKRRRRVNWKYLQKFYLEVTFFKRTTKVWPNVCLPFWGKIVANNPRPRKNRPYMPNFLVCLLNA